MVEFSHEGFRALAELASSPPVWLDGQSIPEKQLGGTPGVDELVALGIAERVSGSVKLTDKGVATIGERFGGSSPAIEWLLSNDFPVAGHSEPEGRSSGVDEIDPVKPEREHRFVSHLGDYTLRLPAAATAGEQLGMLRQSCGVSEVDMAARLQISEQDLAALERRERLPLSQLGRYAAALGATSGELTLRFPSEATIITPLAAFTLADEGLAALPDLPGAEQIAGWDQPTRDLIHTELQRLIADLEADERKSLEDARRASEGR